MPCHCMQPCQESVVEVAVDVGRAMSHRGTLHLCLHLLGRETSPLGRILQIKGIRYRPAWGRGPRNLEEGREARLVARQFGIVWCPGPCRRDLVHVHGCLMLGSERKGAVAPRVSTILSPRASESRVEKGTDPDPRPWSLEPTGTTTKIIEIVAIYTEIPQYLRTTQKEVSCLAVGPWESARFQSRAEIATKKRPRKAKAEKGVFGPNLPRCELPPLFLDRKYL